MLARTTTTPFRQLCARATNTSSSTTIAALRPITTTRLTFASTQLTARRSISITARNMSELKKIFTDKACPPAGPYSQAVAVGAHLFVSGQIPADASGNLVTGSIAVQTEACCKNIAAILEAAGTTVEKVFKVNVFLDDMANFGEMNGVYEKFFAHKPARSCVAVKQLPKGVPVEIECIALA